MKFLLTHPNCITGDIVAYLPLAQSTISQHLKVLKDAGLIQGEIIPPKVKYCLNLTNGPEAKKLFVELFNVSTEDGIEEHCSKES